MGPEARLHVRATVQEPDLLSTDSAYRREVETARGMVENVIKRRPMLDG